jgi:iron complex transport system substrate-binding protein
MTGLPWNEIWYVPGGRSLTAAFIRDAGGRYVWDHLATTDALPMDIEKVYEKAGNADIWINCGNATSLREILAADKRLALFRPVKEKRVYNNDARLNEKGGNDYWESGVLHPDIILQDLQKIFRGEEEGLVYYRRIK